MAVCCRVLMQKVAKELLTMLSWPSITARMAAADSYAGALASGQLAVPATGSTNTSSSGGGSYQAASASAGGPAAHPSGSSGFSLFQRQQPGAAPGGLVDLESLRRLLVVREAALLRGLAMAMKGASQAGGFFDAWMKHQSDLVQAAAQAFAGERDWGTPAASRRVVHIQC